MMREDGSVLHFTNPKVHASMNANTFVINGHGEHREVAEMLPGILNQLGPDDLANLRRIANGKMAARGNIEDDDIDDDCGDDDDDEDDDDDDDGGDSDDIPPLLENFDDASKDEQIDVQVEE